MTYSNIGACVYVYVCGAGVLCCVYKIIISRVDYMFSKGHWMKFAIVIIIIMGNKDLRRLVVTQTPEKSHQLKLVQKNRKNNNNNNNNNNNTTTD